MAGGLNGEHNTTSTLPSGWFGFVSHAEVHRLPSGFVAAFHQFKGSGSQNQYLIESTRL